MMPWLKALLYPFGELVDQHKETFEVVRGRLEGPDHIQSLACKGPRGWYGLDLMSWYMYTLGEELTSLVVAD
jgi:hypothetical protein